MCGGGIHVMEGKREKEEKEKRRVEFFYHFFVFSSSLLRCCSLVDCCSLLLPPRLLSSRAACSSNCRRSLCVELLLSLWSDPWRAPKSSPPDAQPPRSEFLLRERSEDFTTEPRRRRSFCRKILNPDLFSSLSKKIKNKPAPRKPPTPGSPPSSTRSSPSRSRPTSSSRTKPA